jgi:ABC-type Mn2+/Zn2+ transport system ATPase subunit
MLGLALRIVVAKMFTNAGFLGLDESSAGCDVARTAAMAGVLQASGFEQIVWISHSDVTESIGDVNLIEL